MTATFIAAGKNPSSIKHITQHQVPWHIASREPFRASNLEADTVYWGNSRGYGRLPEVEMEKLKKASSHARATGQPLYVVWSYGTPIAWGNEVGLYVPDVKYSATTSRHQGLVRRAL